MNSLLVYGSLMNSKVINLIIGRVPNSIPVTLLGYHRYKIKNKVYPAIYENEGSQVEGLLLEDLNDSEIHKLDKWESDEYLRISVNVKVNAKSKSVYIYRWNANLLDLYGTWDYKVDFIPYESEFILSISQN